MRVLIDTNIALRYVQTDAIHHEEVRQAVDRLMEAGHTLILVPHVIYEFWAVALRPVQANGSGWNTGEVRKTVDDLLELCVFVEDVPEIFSMWLELVTTHEVSGKPTHDAKLAAACLVHGFDVLLTRNTDDFKRFKINVLHPQDVS